MKMTGRERSVSMSEISLFMSPEQTIFGRDSAKEVGKYAKLLGAGKVFVVTDEIIVGLEPFKAVEKSLKDANLDYYVYAEVDQNPTDVQIENGARLYKEEKADLLLSIGGGSSIDSAKAIGILADNPGSIRDYACNYITGMDSNPMNNANPIPPLITIPTTAGTGSEVGAWVVVTNTKDNYKFFAGGWNCLPRVAIVDPVMTSTMPPSLTADTGIDALCHAIEAYCTPYGMPQADVFALEAIKLVVKHLGPAVADGSNIDAREGMAMGALQAGLAMNAGCGGIHALGLQLTSKYGIPHGRTLAIMMPGVMRYNLLACVDRFVDIAKAMGEKVEGLSQMEAAEKAPFAVEQFAQSIGIRTTLSKETEDPELVPICAKHALENENIHGNPRMPTLEEVEELYKQAYGK